MATFAIVHNIPSPYRLHLFAALERELHKRGHELIVHFFAQGHHDRPDSWQHPDISFPHRFWRDYGFSIKNIELHFNPGLICHLFTTRPEYVLVGGPWDTPTGFFASILARSGVKIAWMEGNTITPGRITGLIGNYKRRILAQYNYIAVPGKEGAAFVKLLHSNQAMQHSDTLLFPNLVDEGLFKSAATYTLEQKNEFRKLLGVESEEKLAVWPARLIHVKGLVEFINNMSAELLENWKILVVGEGSLKDEITHVIQLKNLSERVIIMNYIEYEKMPQLYSSADLFVLASLYDPNPLSVVEAMHSGLPLLISNRVGNFPEALEENVNGWGFDPCNPDSVFMAAKQAFSATTEKLAEMGKQSINRAKIYWDTEKSISKFLDVVLE